ncbi:hypothetical protein SFMTTN_3457 [Sulfuriferula multivorans]|uniref:Uncharacterized protein n=1 Tax=Sulfuriferula multivorans TaxID=1559896 RepID=A0A401K070_9PROT|nr:hypothetical protein SFMTTN_3457 [Sulfuriferula multivorans]
MCTQARQFKCLSGVTSLLYVKNAVKVLDYGRASQFGQASQASELAEKAANLWPEMPGF